ncbi:kinetochore protein NDC8 [Blastocystis sp. ATCC 50177/Nand II]|uniref:Kinetochore protein NDC80 n=1 Tax=Blastocystis sp. subtype 1 (strain ATCC 50177 / NandII) TaxID=478820 RepID=A0A196SL86_BLAHN|nr:kinetochore protein NDC8 [Blastocystis sp. ATCC 50177/Nand II]
MDDTRRMSTRNPPRRLSTAVRVSIAPNGTTTTQSTSRMSTMTSTQRRRTTVFDPSSTGLERHLNKEALGANIKAIISFLSLHNYNQEVSTVILRGLNDYDFESIVRFLLRLIDPNIAFEGNVKEEFPRVMHMLGYPTQFPKSMMNSYYAPYYLPTIIAAIKWLTQVADFVQTTSELQQRNRNTGEDLLYSSMKQAYQFFMDNDDESKDIVIQEIADEMNQENQTMESDLARLELRKQDLDDEVKVLANVGKEIPQLQDQEKVLLRDREKFLHIIDGDKRLIASDTNKKEALQARQKEMEETLKALREKNEGLRVKINQQEFSPEQIDQIRNAAKMWREKIDDITGQKQSITARINTMLVDIDKQASHIDQLISQYHSCLTALQLLPPSTEIAKGVDYHLTLEHVEDVNSATVRNAQQYERQIVRNDVLVKLEGVLAEYRKSLEKAVMSYNEEVLKVDDKRQKKEAELEGIKQKIDALKMQCDELEKQRIEFVKQGQTDQVAQDGDVDKLAMENMELNSQVKAKERTVEMLREKKGEKEGEKKTVQQKCDEEERKKQEMIISLLDSVSKYKETMDSEMQRFHAFCENRSVK